MRLCSLHESTESTILLLDNIYYHIVDRKMDGGEIWLTVDNIYVPINEPAPATHARIAGGHIPEELLTGAKIVDNLPKYIYYPDAKTEHQLILKYHRHWA